MSVVGFPGISNFLSGAQILKHSRMFLFFSVAPRSLFFIFFFPQTKLVFMGSFSVTPPGRIAGHLLPETASDKNKSVLAAVLRRPLPKTILLEDFSHKT